MLGRRAGIAVLLALAGALCLSLTSCGRRHDRVEQVSSPAHLFTADRIRACLEKRRGEQHGLIFRTTSRSSSSFVGVVMMDVSRKPARAATVGIAVYDDADLLDAYEERARQDPTDRVRRVRNAVVSYQSPDSPNIALGERWVQDCLRSS